MSAPHVVTEAAAGCPSRPACLPCYQDSRARGVVLGGEAARFMETEKERTGGHPRKGQKRRQVPNQLVRATETRRARWAQEDMQPEAKKARLSTILFAGNCEITHGQLCELLKYAVLGKSNISRPSWCQIFHQNHLKNVVIFILQGMSQLHFYKFYMEFEFLRKTFRHKFCLPAPSSNFLADIIGLQKKTAGDVPKNSEGSLPSASSKANINLQDNPIIQKYGSNKVDLINCLLTVEEMKTFRFPLQGSPGYENFVPTKCNGSITDRSPLFGLDCEMCLTSKGKEITRISLVAEGGCCIMDELVKPDDKIVDYLTRKDIHRTNRVGYDATEDARTALELAQYFLKNGPKKIAELNLESLGGSNQKLQEAGQKPKNRIEVQHPNASVLECLHLMGQKLLFVAWETDATKFSSYGNCETIKCLSNKEVFDQARVEVPLFPFSIVQFSFESFSPVLTEEMSKKMKTKWREMSTVYVGPVSKTCNFRALKRLLKSFGPVESMSFVLETYQLHLCVQYEVLEAAQLAIESLNGVMVEGIYVKVRRPVTELTLDCDILVNELAQDSENRDTIYLSGVSEAFKEHMFQQCDHFRGLEAVILPKESGKQKKYCFLKFKTSGNAQRALTILAGKDWKLKGRGALTPRHLHEWLRDFSSESRRPPGLRITPLPSDQQALQTLKTDHPKIAAWHWGQKIGKLYHNMDPGTLCLVLLPGSKSSIYGSLPGLGLMAIKDEEGCTATGMGL
ncbi:RNA exonuclease 5 isoform X4 [Cavia porcellus]|uniref:RNA exonuclease 5 n=1 Tax=Cavia porcellus TaxID=10141 RepID=A0A286XNP1_CAVPO|nr:RNA exonuclease 5 isoform X3 [Cavia porcellus]